MTKFLSILYIIFYTITYVQLYSAPKIHVFGDSHSVCCFIKSNKPHFLDEFITINYLGSITMHRIGRDGLDIKNYNVLDGDVIIYVFGEIDARCHILKQKYEKNRKLKEIISTLATNYISTIVSNHNSFNNITSVVMCIVPPTNKFSSPNFPFYGALEERIKVTKLLNLKLNELCTKNNILFLDIYKIFAKETGELNPIFSDSTVHIHWFFNNQIKDILSQMLKIDFNKQHKYKKLKTKIIPEKN